jgi:hypothetical protein
MQDVNGSWPSMKHSVGIAMPSLRAASRTVAPWGTSTSLPSMFNRGMRRVPSFNA